MDIFDLDIKDFEKKIDELLKNITVEELLEELINNGLTIDEYDSECSYIEEDLNNIWIHKIKTSNIKEKVNIFLKRNGKINLLEAA